LLPSAFAVAFAGSAFAQSYSEPSRSFLHQIVQEWTEKSAVGNLRTATFSDDEIELRIWAGFGLRGSYGGILHRQGGTWTASHLELNRYTAGATNEIAVRDGLLPPTIVEEMESRCVIETLQDSDGSPLEYSLSCAHARPSSISTSQQLAELWEMLVGLGILTLPPTIERDWIMMDGHSYVIEVRVGSQYRATVTEHADETPVDEQIHQIVMAVDLVLNTLLYGGYE
jgi:hypothetical protein